MEDNNKVLSHYEVNYNENQLFVGNEDQVSFIAYSKHDEFLTVRRRQGARLVKRDIIHEFSIGNSKIFEH